jgi:general secretion pathway protein D
VQVKMSIEQKDVLGVNTLTPTFTERTMAGTARVQNNRTMMLASISTDIDTRGRKGIAFIGGLPIIGRLFTSPTRDLRQVDIVISVTPRVLRAPAVTPRDEEMRPSGTLQSPTTGSLAEMIREADRDDQIAAARVIPRNVTVQLPDAPLEVAKPVNTAQNTAQPVPVTPPPSSNSFASSPATATKTVAAENNKPTTIEELPSYVPAPKSLVSDRAASDVATVNSSSAGTQNAVLTGMPKTSEASLAAGTGSARVAQLSFLPAEDVMKVGEKHRYAIQLNSDVPLSHALVALKFDPSVLKVNAVTAGSLLVASPDGAPLFTPSIDATGVCLVSISALNGRGSIKGSGALLFIEVEAIGMGNASLNFVKETLHLVATDARDVVSEVIQGKATVKQ